MGAERLGGGRGDRLTGPFRRVHEAADRALSGGMVAALKGRAGMSPVLAAERDRLSRARPVPTPIPAGRPSPEWVGRQEWLCRLADHVGVPRDVVIERAFSAYAESVRFAEPFPGTKGES